ncbi:hypothetical protein ACFCXR_22020 [Streptomyces noursei]|uniref:hypothetical protein n=1 Tax=Streptomyces TaxID=1883 RepID=UPI0035E1FA0C
MTTSQLEVGDLVHDSDRDAKAVVTDISRGRPVLRKLFGGGESWIPTDLTKIKIEARRGAWRLS